MMKYIEIAGAIVLRHGNYLLLVLRNVENKDGAMPLLEGSVCDPTRQSVLCGDVNAGD